MLIDDRRSIGLQSFEWTKLLRTSTNHLGEGIKLGLDGSIYITAYTKGDLDGQINSGETDIFIRTLVAMEINNGKNF